MMLNTIQIVVNATFLFLAIILISERWDNSNASEGLTAAKKEIQDVMQSNMYYMEGKVNRVAESSDSYQVNTNSRITVLENRMMSLESRRKESARITNTNTAIVNGNVPDKLVAKESTEQ